MNITINKPAAFRMYNQQIGVILYCTPEKSNFFVPGRKHISLSPDKLDTIRIDFIQDELEENEELRELAEYHDLITIHRFDRIAYLNYTNSFNI